MKDRPAYQGIMTVHIHAAMYGQSELDVKTTFMLQEGHLNKLVKERLRDINIDVSILMTNAGEWKSLLETCFKNDPLRINEGNHWDRLDTWARNKLRQCGFLPRTLPDVLVYSKDYLSVALDTPLGQSAVIIDPDDLRNMHETDQLYVDLLQHQKERNASQGLGNCCERMRTATGWDVVRMINEDIGFTELYFGQIGPHSAPHELKPFKFCPWCGYHETYSEEQA